MITKALDLNNDSFELGDLFERRGELFLLEIILKYVDGQFVFTLYNLETRKFIHKNQLKPEFGSIGNIAKDKYLKKLFKSDYKRIKENLNANNQRPN